VRGKIQIPVMQINTAIERQVKMEYFTFVEKSAMDTSLIPRYTYADYKQWKEDWELIKGYPYQLLPSARWQHNSVQVRLSKQAIDNFDRNSNCNCMVFTELDWKISNETVVRPDVMIVCGKIETDYLEFPPVLIVEILAPASLVKDRNIKFELYRENGVKYYLLADYTKETVEVFELIDNQYRSVEKNTFILNHNCSVEFDFAEIFKQ